MVVVGQHVDMRPDPAATAPSQGRPWGRWFVVAVAVGLVGMWGYIYWFQWSGRGEALNELDDETWAPQAEALCEPVRAAMLALPSGSDFEGVSLAGRADVLDQITVMYDDLLVQLAALPQPASDKDRTLLTEWFADWDVYQRSRAAHSEKLRAGQDEQFVLLADQPVDGRMQFFAETNRMLSCDAPGDV